MNKLKFVLIALFAVAFCFKAKAQGRPMSMTDSVQVRPTNALFFELLGPGLVYSINYDTRFYKRNDGIGMRAGIGYFSDDNGDGHILSVPVVVNYLLGKRGKYLELGAGLTYYDLNTSFAFFDNARHDNPKSGVFGTLNFGFRLQPEDAGFCFRTGLAPIIKGGTFAPYWPYVSFGYSF